jgi:hypothetical protein
VWASQGVFRNHDEPIWDPTRVDVGFQGSWGGELGGPSPPSFHGSHQRLGQHVGVAGRRALALRHARVALPAACDGSLHSAPLLIGQDEKRYRLPSSHATQAVLQVAREVNAVAFPQLDCVRSKDNLHGP